MASKPSREELLKALEMVQVKVDEISVYMEDAFKCEDLGDKPSRNKIEKAFIATCRKLLVITEHCPETLFGANLGNCGNCQVDNFPQEMERELACMQEYYLREAGKVLMEATKDGDIKDRESGGKEKTADMEKEFELS